MWNLLSLGDSKDINNLIGNAEWWKHSAEVFAKSSEEKSESCRENAFSHPDTLKINRKLKIANKNKIHTIKAIFFIQISNRIYE